MTKKRYFLISVFFCALLSSCSNGLRENGSVSIAVTLPSSAAVSAARTAGTSSSSYTVDITLASGKTILYEQKKSAAAGEKVVFTFSALPLGTSLTGAGSVYLGTELYASLNRGSVTVSEEPQNVVLTPSASTGTIKIVMPEIGEYHAGFTSVSSDAGITVTLAVTDKDGTEVTPESSGVKMFLQDGTDLAKLFSGYFGYDQTTRSFTIPSLISAGTYSVFCSFTIGG